MKVARGETRTYDSTRTLMYLTCTGLYKVKPFQERGTDAQGISASHWRTFSGAVADGATMAQIVVSVAVHSSSWSHIHLVTKL